MTYSKPVTDIIQDRFSCRSYRDEAISAQKQQALRELSKQLSTGLFGTTLRFQLIAADEQDRKSLRGLGTYGFIKGASGFLIGTTCPGLKDLEDYGYRLEQLILTATDLGLGTCWLGGTFAKSNFARKIDATGDERLPAVAAIGNIADEAQARKALVRQHVGGDYRLVWESLFFEEQFGIPLSQEKAGSYAEALQMVRLGPSASNKQPWRVIQSGSMYHFYLQRTPGYRSIFTRLAGVEDMQRVDMGIAMCHFELTARELGLDGSWMINDPGIDRPDELTEYSVSWVGK